MATKVTPYPIVTMILVFVFLSSCFKEDERVPPYVWNGLSYYSEVSMYTHQVFYKLEDNSVKGVYSMDSWDLAFESAPSGWHIVINSGNYIGVWATGSFNPENTSFPSNGLPYLYDSSSGNPDSTAFGNWIDGIQAPAKSRGEVYLVGKYDGLQYSPFKKIVFKEVTDSSYVFSVGEVGNTQLTVVTIEKDSSCSYTYYSFQKGVLQIEPAKEDWDLLFTQYATTLYTNQGVPTPYFVRGILLNPWNTLAALDTTQVFEYIDENSLSLFHFSGNRDVIGHDWKSVEVDEASNEAKYFIRPKNNYIVKDSQGNYFKIRFVGFYDELGSPGYPSMEYLQVR